MDNQLNTLIEKIVERKLKEMQPMTREPAVVMSADETKAVVRFLSGSEYELLNKTGEVLSAGDSVWVEYRTLPSSGYISMRNGEAAGLYKPADDMLRANLTGRFRTTVKAVTKAEFSELVGATRSFKIADIPAYVFDTAHPDYFYVLHISRLYYSGQQTLEQMGFSLRHSGSVITTRTPAWIGNEAYINFQASSSYDMELYVDFGGTVTGEVTIDYDIYRLNFYENRFTDPPSGYEVNVNTSYEGAGSVRYSEFVRYVAAQLESLDTRLTNIGG